MHSAPVQANNPALPFARFGYSHGYRLEGDSALLNAQIDIDPGAADAVPSLALQLWACDEPYQGGPLSGFKIAEAPLALSALGAAARHDAVAFARPPAANQTDARDYSMVLVLAAGREGAFDQVYDFANYPARQRFVVPHLAGAAGYKQHEDGSLSVQVDRVLNPRDTENLSGTLSLQLWASDRPYRGGELNGVLLASHELGQLRGQDALAPGELRSPAAMSSIPAASHIVLALCEWTALGYLPRDHCNFGEPYQAPARAAAEPVAAPRPATKPAAAAPAAAAREAPSAAAAARPTKTAAVATAEAPVAAAVGATKPAASEAARPSLNTISVDELAKLAGVMPKVAAEVLKARPFKSFDELRSVRGIGDKTIEKLRKLLTI